MIKIQVQKKKGFSLLEMIVSLGIIAVILILFFNVITSVISVSVKTNARAQARTEIETIVNLIRQDIRNAEEITFCGEDRSLDPRYCTMITNGKTVTWGPCTDSSEQLCRYEGAAANTKLTYRMPGNLYYEYLNFSPGFSQQGDTSKKNINFTFAVSNVNSELSIKNLTSSNNISTRNYTAFSFNQLIECGNGILELGEECDDGNGINDDGCSNTCIADITCDSPQNLFQNGCFEDVLGCAPEPSGGGTLTFTEQWESFYTSSTETYNCGLGLVTTKNIRQAPAQGDSYIGFHPRHTFQLPEYITSELAQPITGGKTCTLEASISLGEVSIYRSDITFMFSSGPPTPILDPKCSPSGDGSYCFAGFGDPSAHGVTIDSSEVSLDKNIWTRIEKEFTMPSRTDGRTFTHVTVGWIGDISTEYSLQRADLEATCGGGVDCGFGAYSYYGFDDFVLYCR